MKNPTEENNHEPLLKDLEALHQYQVPNLKMPAVQTLALVPERNARWRPMALAAAAVAGLVLFAGGMVPFGSSTTGVSAETILQRTAGAASNNAPAANQTSYYMVSRSHSVFQGASRSSIDSEREVWYRDAQHQRTENREIGNRGNVTFGQSQSGSDLWIYSTVDGKTSAVHGTVDTLGLRPITGATVGADSLTELLSLYSSGGCSSAKLVQEEKVLGRNAYVIEVKPTWDTCQFQISEIKNVDITSGTAGTAVGSITTPAVMTTPVTVELNSFTPSNVTVIDSSNIAGSGFVIVNAASGDTTTRMWVDAETFITLKTESYTDGVLMHRYEVTVFETDISIPDSTFTYTPPPGVQVVEAKTPADARGAMAGVFGISISGGGIAIEPAVNQSLVP